MAAALPKFDYITGERRFRLDELDSITLCAAALTDDGDVMPAGSTGTIVAVYGRAEGFCVEFEEPFHALATVLPDQIGSSDRAD